MTAVTASIALMLVTPPLAVAAGAGELGSDVDGLLDFAKANPELASMRSEAVAASQRVYPAGAFPDPTFRLELEDVTNSASDAPASLLPSRVGSAKYTLMQTLPWWGKRDLRRGVAEAESAQATGRVATTWAEIASGVKTMYARYYLAFESEAISRELLDLMNRLERVALARYEGGLAPQQDVIRAQVETTAIRSDLLTLESEREAARSGLNAMLGREPLAPLARPMKLRPMPPPAHVEPPALIERLHARSPQIFVEDARITAAEKNKSLTYRNRFPDVTAGIFPTQMGSRVAEWGVMFEVSIPLQQQTRRHQEAEAEAMLEAAKRRKDSLANRLTGELQENVAALAAAQRIVVLTTNSLLPQAEATLQSAMAAYETGKVDFATLLEAQRQIRRSKLDRLKAQVEAQTRLAAIERLLGEDL